MLVNVLAKSGEAAKSGPMGLAVILILCIVCYFLFKSMSKHLKTVRERYPIDPADAERDEHADTPSEADAAATDKRADPPAE